MLTSHVLTSSAPPDGLVPTSSIFEHQSTQNGDVINERVIMMKSYSLLASTLAEWFEFADIETDNIVKLQLRSQLDSMFRTLEI